jgi:AcrR family transcriptional regulator
MSWNQDKNKRHGRGYHHGNLREALIEAALGLIARKGPEGFTFAEAAREAGVSAAAPYRHFRDREALVLEVARRGFEKFSAQLQKAWADGKPNALAALKNVGSAYLAFARDETALFTAMFESGISVSADRDLKKASDAAFEVVKLAAEALCSQIDKERRPPALMVALHIWSLTHGLACLFARGDEARRSLPMPVEDLLEAGVLVYLDGLGIRR